MPPGPAVRAATAAEVVTVVPPALSATGVTAALPVRMVRAALAVTAVTAVWVGKGAPVAPLWPRASPKPAVRVVTVAASAATNRADLRPSRRRRSANRPLTTAHHLLHQPRRPT